MAEHPTLAVLRRRDVRWFISARFFAAAAVTLQRSAIAWHVFDLTHSAFYLGLIGLVQFLPVLPMGLWGGAVADAFDRRRIVLIAQLAACALALVLYGSTAAGQASLWLIFATIFALAIAWSFESPAGSALLPTLVPPELFPNAVTLLATFRNLAWASGPVLAGFAIDAFGLAWAYALGAGLFAASLATMARVRSPDAGEARAEVTWSAVREGVEFVRTRPVLVSSMTLDMFAVIFASVTALLPIYASEILGVGARGYGLLSGSLQIGTFIMSVALVALPPIQRPGRALLLAVAAFGASTILFGLSRSFTLSVVALIGAGMADQISMVTRQTIVQLATPDALRGRVSSVNMIFIGASNQLGDVESGFVAALIGATLTVVFGGLACLGVLALIAVRVPQLRTYEPLARNGREP